MFPFTPKYRVLFLMGTSSDAKALRRRLWKAVKGGKIQKSFVVDQYADEIVVKYHPVDEEVVKKITKHLRAISHTERKRYVPPESNRVLFGGPNGYRRKRSLAIKLAFISLQ